jgi:hypothetical protein
VKLRTAFLRKDRTRRSFSVRKIRKTEGENGCRDRSKDQAVNSHLRSELDFFLQLESKSYIKFFRLLAVVNVLIRFKMLGKRHIK